MEFTLVPVAWVVSTRHSADDDAWDHEQSHIVLDEAIPTDALSGIETFSHLEIIAVAHQVADAATHSWRRRPRGRTEWPEQGIFAQRNKDRPNRLLSTVVELIRVDNRELHVRGLDLIDGTPVVDIKPVFRWSGPRTPLIAPAWSDELGRDYF